MYMYFSSYIENLCAPNPDPKLKIHHYNRTHEMDIELGLTVPDNDDNDKSKDSISNNQKEENEQEEEKEEEENDKEVSDVMVFPANCSNCNLPCDTKMHVINIPYFKDVVIMSTVCDVS